MSDFDSLHTCPYLLPSPKDNKATKFFKAYVHKHGATKAVQIFRNLLLKSGKISEGLHPILLRLTPLTPLSIVGQDIMNFRTKRRGVSKQRVRQLLLTILSEYVVQHTDLLETEDEIAEELANLRKAEERWYEDYEEYYESKSYRRSELG